MDNAETHTEVSSLVKQYLSSPGAESELGRASESYMSPEIGLAFTQVKHGSGRRCQKGLLEVRAARFKIR